MINKIKIHITNIVWDADDSLELPNTETLEVPDDTNLEDTDLADILSDKYGYCVDSLTFEVLE